MGYTVGIMASNPLRILMWLAATALTAGVLAAQEPPPPPPVDPDLPAKLKELKSMVADRKMSQDFQAIGLIQDLTKAPESLNPKDQSKIAKALGQVFKTGKVRPAGQDHVYREAGDALGKFGLDGSKELARILDNKRVKDNVPLRAHLIEALGRTKDEKRVDWILDEATRSPHDEIRRAAGKALGEFTDIKIKDRREIVKDMIRAWGSLHSKATQPVNTDPNAPIDFGPENARKTLRAIESTWIATLSRQTGQSMTQFADWQRWLNKNKNWDPPGQSK